MAEYNVVEAVEIEGVQHEAGAVVSLDEAVGAPLVEEGKLSVHSEE